MGGFGGMMGGGGGMGGILPMLTQGQSMGIIPMLMGQMGQGGAQGGPQQQEQSAGQLPPSFLQPMQPRQGGFLGSRQPALADLLQGRLGRGY